MVSDKFDALVVKEDEGGGYSSSVEERSISDLPDGDVLVRVKYSSLNYKDALASIGKKGIAESYPHTTGIDAAGVVEESSVEGFSGGEEVIVTGYDLGMGTSGGHQKFIRVPSGWVVKKPEGLSLRESMIYGTAGYTAALSVYKLIEYGVGTGDGEILVSGATGGVGSFAIEFLAKEDYNVVAATGKVDEKEFLRNLGAARVIHRSEVDDTSGRELLSERWAGMVDTVGGNILATGIKSVKYDGVVTCCGNVASADLPVTVYPFILRGVNLLGVASAESNMDLRLKIWSKISNKWKLDSLEDRVNECSLEELGDRMSKMLDGKSKGRVIIDLTR